MPFPHCLFFLEFVSSIESTNPVPDVFEHVRRDIILQNIGRSKSSDLKRHCMFLCGGPFVKYIQFSKVKYSPTPQHKWKSTIQMDFFCPCV